jgi:2,4-dienoyl-CoA reductase-like NADH-dependent reductase (Old Yellow Enzyme family)
MEYKLLKSGIRIKDVHFKNRMVMPPLVIWQSDESAEVKEVHERHYRMSAGPGLMIVEATTVSPEGKLHAKQLGIFDDRHIEGLSRLADLIRSSGAVSGIQIHHGGAKATPKSNWGHLPFAPSVDGSQKPSSKECRELSTDEIHRIEDDFAAAAVRAEKAGFQYIELHFAHGYLGTQFLSPHSNTRTDEYGGSLENRQRFLIETYRRCKEAVSDEVILSCRLGVVDKKEGGISIEEGAATARSLAAEGAPLLHISCGHGVADSVKPEGSSFNPLFHLAAGIKKEIDVPVIGVGGIVDPADGEQALETGMADFVAVGKGMLADPEWAKKVSEDRGEEIDACIGCPRCFWFSDPGKCPVRLKTGNTL